MPHKPADAELFAANLRQLMEEHDVNQIELSDLCGIHRVNVSKYCRGTTSPSLTTARKIAAVFGVTLDSFFEVDRPPVLSDDADTVEHAHGAGRRAAAGMEKVCGYDINSLTTLAFCLNHNGIRPEMLESWMLDFKFAYTAVWSAKQEIIRENVNSILIKEVPLVDWDWREEWEEKHKNEPIKRDFYIPKEREKNDNKI